MKKADDRGYFIVMLIVFVTGFSLWMHFTERKDKKTRGKLSSVGRVLKKKPASTRPFVKKDLTDKEVVQLHLSAALWVAKLSKNALAKKIAETCTEKHVLEKEERPYKGSKSPRDKLKMFVVKKEQRNFASFFCPSFSMWLYKSTPIILTKLTLGLVTLHECMHVLQCIKKEEPHKYFAKSEVEAWRFTSKLLREVGGEGYVKLLEKKKEEILSLHERNSFPLNKSFYIGKIPYVRIENIFKTKSKPENNYLAHNLLFGAYSELYEKTYTRPYAWELKRRMFLGLVNK